jgi:[acyl-carrier-protein] S-malonyltransferase
VSGPTAILCSGQGTQHAGMFDLTGQLPEAQRVFEAARAVLEGKDPRQFVRDAEPATLYSNRVGQVLCCTQALAAWALIQGRLSRPVVIAGYSVGELAAWGCAGLLNPEEVLRLAALRAEVMDAAGNGNTGLAAIRGLGRAQLESICQPHDVHIAIVNSDDLFIAGGVCDALRRVCDEALKAGAVRAGMLHVAVAAHTPLLAEASRRFDAVLTQLNLAPEPPPDVRLLSGIDGEAVFDTRWGARKLAEQISRTVDWAACLDACRAMGAKTVLELGPGRALANLAREVLRDAQVRSIEDFRTPEGVLKWVTSAG